MRNTEIFTEGIKNYRALEGMQNNSNKTNTFICS